MESESYGPPRNLGMCQEIHTEMTVYSNIWGRDLSTKLPNEYKVSVDIAMMGHWAFLSVGECIHPVSHMRYMDADEKDGSKKEIGDEWNGWWDEY